MTETPATATPLVVEYQNTVDDWNALRTAFAAEQTWWTRLGPILFLEAMIAGSCLPGLLFLMAMGQFGSLLAAAGAVALLNVLLFLAIRRPGSPDPKIFRPTTLALHPQYLEVFNDRGWERRDWRTIARVQATEGLLAIQRDDQLLYAVPHRAFPSAEASEAFRSAAQQFHAAAQALPLEDRPAAWQESAGPPAVAAADTLQVTFSLSAEELAELPGGAVLHPVNDTRNAQHKPTRTSNAWTWLLVVAILVMILILPASSRQALAPSLVAFFVFLILSVLMIFPVWRLLRLFIGRNVKPGPAVTQTVTISPSGVSLWAPGVETYSAWDTIDAVQQSDRAIIFSANRPVVVHLHTIPKSAFAAPIEADRFAHTAARYRQTAADRAAEHELTVAPHVETGNPYQPPQSR